MNSGLILTIVALVTLLITAAAGVGGSWRLSRNTQSVNVYRENALAWQQKAELQSGQITDLQTASAVKDQQIIELKARLSTLEGVVTGKSMIQELSQRLDLRWTELLAQVSELRGGQRQIQERLSITSGSGNSPPGGTPT
jgi:hypothetical protein